MLDEWGSIDILVNATGGNIPEATLPPGAGLSELDSDAFRAVVDSNLMGVLLPTQVFAAAMVEKGRGSIVNPSCRAASRPLTRVARYGAAMEEILTMLP